MRISATGLSVLAFGLVTAQSTLADSLSVKMTLTGLGAGTGVTFHYDTYTATTGKTWETAFAGLYEWKGYAGNQWPLDRPFESFCIDLNQTITVGSTYWYTLKDLADAPTPDPQSPGGMGEERAQLLRQLWGEDRGKVQDNITAAAFQVAVWEIVFESKPTYADPVFSVSASSSSKGSFYIDTSTTTGWKIADQANKYLQDAQRIGAKSEPMLMALSSNGQQDQLVVMPLPATAWSGAFLLGGLAAHSARRRHRTGFAR